MKTNRKDPMVTVFSRNIFYKQLHYLALSTLALTIIIIGVLIGILYFLIRNPQRPLYFAADSVGRLIQIVPVDRPNMSNDEVINWAVEALQTAFSYDFVNYRGQLQSAQKYFTTYGWSTYMRGLTLSGNLLAVTGRKQIVIAQVVPPVKIVAQGILGGAYAWKFEMRVLMTYWEPPFDNESKVLNPLDVTMIVQRQEILQSYKGLGVLQVIARFATSPSTQPQEISRTPTG
ncbi:DotI/IcmL/TraM family protein [Aquicella lusitana]|uniref:Intracellular multiplication protein IcmL n=1 Tax=Aquicella lusitana TaxID=254246 RepID=A0A370H3G4_9COXI|nr:DotI/IcmL/TraM family protein [Aquicella lusitana]RDI48613.1 intracellular multiplication protein IcmL [Aquicella lusitana]VVC74010.1 hypothetical protein AQULUS_17720 [Aquicella lusitana]